MSDPQREQAAELLRTYIYNHPNDISDQNADASEDESVKNHK